MSAIKKFLEIKKNCLIKLLVSAQIVKRLKKRLPLNCQLFAPRLLPFGKKFILMGLP